MLIHDSGMSLNTGSETNPSIHTFQHVWMKLQQGDQPRWKHLPATRQVMGFWWVFSSVLAPLDGAEASTLNREADFEFSWPLTGGRSADPEPTGSSPAAAGWADPEEVLPHGHPEETQQTAHPATFQISFTCTGGSCLRFKPHLQLQLCRFRRSSPEQSSSSPSALSSRHPAHLEGQAEEGQAQPSGRAGVGRRQAGQRLPGHISWLKQ